VSDPTGGEKGKNADADLDVKGEKRARNSTTVGGERKHASSFFSVKKEKNEGPYSTL